MIISTALFILILISIVDGDQVRVVRYSEGRTDCQLPWIWDAVYHQTSKKLELLLIPHSSCYMNSTALLELVDKIPSYEHYYPFLRVNTNRSAPSCEHSSELHKLLHRKTLLGQYTMNSRRSTKKIRSHIIRGSRNLAFLAPLRVEFGPIPSINVSKNFDLILPRSIFKPESTTQSTIMKDIPISVAPTELKQFQLSMCTVTTNRNRNELIEWIEYHRALGIQHFYFYDTYIRGATEDENISLSRLLHTYVSMNIATVTYWPYDNCYKGINICRAACHYIYNNETLTNEPEVCFNPPSCINHISALSSCYLRYRHTSQYMVTIDDDEFIHLHPKYFFNRENSPLINYIETVKTFYPQLIQLRGIALQPMLLMPCDQRNTKQENTQNQLPRLELPKLSLMVGNSHEVKWILNTDLVEMLTVHYLTERTLVRNYTLESRTIIHRANYTNEDAFLFHYKNFSSQMLFDVSINPLSLSDYQWREDYMCNDSLPWKITRDHIGDNTNKLLRGKQREFIEDVRRRYQSYLHNF